MRTFSVFGAIDSRSKKENIIFCKLDIGKASDHIEWNFLLLVLEKIGFGGKWINWIKLCVSATSFSLVNGTTTGFLFQIS